MPNQMTSVPDRDYSSSHHIETSHLYGASALATNLHPSSFFISDACSVLVSLPYSTYTYSGRSLQWCLLSFVNI